MGCARHLSDGHTWYLAKWDAIQNLFFFSGTGHSSHCPELTPLWLSAESAALLVFPWEQLTTACGAAVNTASSPQESSLGAAGQLIQLCPFPGAQEGSAAICWPCSGLGGQYFRPCFCTLGYSCWHSRLHSLEQNQQSIKAVRWYQPLSVLTTQSHKWKNFCSKQPRLLYYLFPLFYNTPEHNLKLPLESTRLTVPFFSAW